MEQKKKETVGTMFSGKDLRKLIIPLVIEQTLAVMVGMADTIMIASRGEQAVSGVSIVDTIAVLLIGLFSALATGGAVVSAQFIGRKDEENASKAANQLVVAIGSMALFVMTISLLFNKQILQLIYRIAPYEYHQCYRKCIFPVCDEDERGRGGIGYIAVKNGGGNHHALSDSKAGQSDSH